MKRWIRKIRGLSPEDRRLLAAVGRRLVIARLLTKYTKFQRWSNLMKAPLQSLSTDSKPIDYDRIRWAVTTVARRFPGTYSCLPQAIAGCWTLRKLGIPAEIRIGVKRDDNAKFAAHAWVEVDSKVVIGGLEESGGVGGFSHLMDLNGEKNQ